MYINSVTFESYRYVYTYDVSHRISFIVQKITTRVSSFRQKYIFKKSKSPKLFSYLFKSKPRRPKPNGLCLPKETRANNAHGHGIHRYYYVADQKTIISLSGGYSSRSTSTQFTRQWFCRSRGPSPVTVVPCDDLQRRCR
jgi:hypothetical protein